MAQHIPEGNLTFHFPTGWNAVKYDDWSFYRNQFQRVCGSSKGVDILAVVHSKTTWLIEVKDYRRYRRTKAIELADEIAFKVRDTLAGIVTAAVRANDTDEKDFARLAVSSDNLRVVLHLEQPRKHSKLFPRAIDPSEIKQKLKKLLKPIDPHLLVLDKTSVAACALWSVT